MKLLIQAIADLIDDNGALGLKTPAPAVEVSHQVEVKPGESWGATKAFEIYLGGIAQYIDSTGLGELAAIKAKVNELAAAYNQLRTDYNSSVVPTTALPVDPLP